MFLHCAAFGRDHKHCRLVPRSDSVSREWWCSSYSCCNLSPPAGSWTETEEIDRLKENGRVTVAATHPLLPARGLKREEIDWLKENGRLTAAATRPLPPARGLKQKEINRATKGVRLTVAATRPLLPARGLKQRRLIDWRKMFVLLLL